MLCNCRNISYGRKRRTLYQRTSSSSVVQCGGKTLFELCTSFHFPFRQTTFNGSVLKQLHIFRLYSTIRLGISSFMFWYCIYNVSTKRTHAHTYTKRLEIILCGISYILATVFFFAFIANIFFCRAAALSSNIGAALGTKEEIQFALE